MAHNDKCKKCAQSVGGKPDDSDYCSDCQFDPETGWGSYIDHSDSDNDVKRREK